MERSGNDAGPGHAGQQTIHGRLHGIQVEGIRTKQDALRQFVVFGLAEQIHRHPISGRTAVRQHQDFAGPGNHVDAHFAKDLALGLGHVVAPRPGDFVHSGNRLRPPGQGRNRLSAADGKDPIHAGQTGRRQHQGIALAARRRHGHDDLPNASHAGRDGIHQHRRRVGRLATGHIDADPIQRNDFLPEADAQRVGKAPVAADGALLFFMETANSLCRCLQGLALIGVDAGERQFHLRTADFKLAHAGGLGTVPARRVLQHGCVAASAHIIDDGRNLASHRGLFAGRDL